MKKVCRFGCYKIRTNNTYWQKTKYGYNEL